MKTIRQYREEIDRRRGRVQSDRQELRRKVNLQRNRLAWRNAEKGIYESPLHRHLIEPQIAYLQQRSKNAKAIDELARRYEAERDPDRKLALMDGLRRLFRAQVRMLGNFNKKS